MEMTKGMKIRKARKEKGLTQLELAKKIGLNNKQTISKYENDVVTNIPSDVLMEICKVLDMSPAYVMGWDNKHELIVEILSDDEMSDCVCKIQSLNDENKKTVFNYVDYIYNKEGH